MEMPHMKKIIIFLMGKLGFKNSLMMLYGFLFTIMVITISGLSFYITSNISFTQFKDATNNFRDNVKSDLEKQLNFYDTVILDIAYNRQVQNVISGDFNDVYETIIASNEISRNLSIVKSYSSDISDISFYLAKKTPIDINTFIKTLNDSNKVWLESIMKSGIALKWDVEDDGAIKFLTVTRAVKNIDNGENLGAIKISLNMDIFEKIMKKNEETSNFTSLFYDKNGELLGTADEDYEFLGKEIIEKKLNGSFFETKINGKKQYGSVATLKNEGIIVVVVPKTDKILRGYNINLVLIIVVAIIVLLAGILLNMFFSSVYSSGVNSLVHKIKAYSLGAEIEKEKVYSNDELSYLEDTFDEMTNRINILYKDIVEYKMKLRDIEFEILQAQIKPHFLYNTLSYINWMAIDVGSKDISNAINTLSRYYRYTLSTGQDIIKIEDEIQQINAYVDLMLLRKSGEITFDIKCENDLLKYKTPKILLQPFVENAILHNNTQIREPLNICVFILRSEKGIIFKIQDNGKGITKEQIDNIFNRVNKTNSYGIRNIIDRIKLLYGEDYGVKIDSVLGEGTTVEISIPFVCEESEKND
jgi:two-component system sensor histidine kinase YesM